MEMLAYDIISTEVNSVVNAEGIFKIIICLFITFLLSFSFDCL